MPTPASDDCNPSVIAKLSRLSETLGIPISLKPDKGVPRSSDQLQASFDEAFSAYMIEARKGGKARKVGKAQGGKARVCTPLRHCETRLIKIVLNFRTSKVVNPDMYLDVVKLPAIESMLLLLKGSYPCREELAGFILSAFAKLTDPDILVDGQEEVATLFVESLDKFEALDVFVSALGKFPGDDAVIPAVQTITQMIYLKPELAGTAGQKTELMAWVLTSLRSSKWNDLKMYAVGFLNTLLMPSVENRYLFGEEVVIVVVNALSSIQEEEVPHEVHVLQNLFSCLLYLLECPGNIESFATAGGVQSMIGFVQEEDFGHCYGSAIVALDIAVKACPSASQQFVNEFVTDDSAFDSAFDTAFVMIPLSIMHDEEEIEEHQISLIASLIGGIAKTEKDSLLKKIEENDFRRFTWLMELYKRYSEKVEAMTNHLKGKQSVDVILGYLWSSENSTIQSRIKSQLTHHKLEMKHVEDSLSVYRDNIGNAGESVESPKTAMEECIDSLEERKS